jgi:hypothetical protein
MDMEKGKAPAEGAVGKLHPIQLYFKDLHFSVKLNEKKSPFKRRQTG